MIDREQLEFLVSIRAIDIGTAKAFLALDKQVREAEATMKRADKVSQQYERSQISRIKKITAEEQKAVSALKALEAQKAKMMNAKIASGNDWVRINQAIKTATAAVSKHRNELGKIAVTQNDYNKKIVKASQNYGFLNAKLKQTDLELKRINVAAYQGIKSLSVFGQAGSSIFEGTFRIMRRILTTMITLGGLYWFKGLIQSGMEFEHSMIRIGALVKATTDDFKKLTKGLRDAARQTVYTATEVTDVATILGQAGYNTKQIIESVMPILGLAAANMGELGATTELVIGIMKSWNIETSKTADVVNILTEATIESLADITKLGIAFNYAGPAGAAFNQTVETTTAVLARFMDAGMAASTAGTTFRHAIIELASGSAREVKTLKELNLTLEQVNPEFNDMGKIIQTLAKTSINGRQAIELFGQRAGAAMYLLIDRIRSGGEAITDFAKQLSDAKEIGRVTEIYNKMLSSVRSQSMLTKAELEDMGISLFQVFKPAMIQVILSFRDAVKSFNENLKSDTGKNFSDLLLGLVPVFQSLISALVDIISIFGKLLYIILELNKMLPILNGLMYIIIYGLGVLALKSLLFNKYTIAIVSATWSFIKALTSEKAMMQAVSVVEVNAITGMTALTTATTAATRATLGLNAAMKKNLIFLAISVAVMGLVAGIEYLIDKFGKAKKTTDDASNSISGIGDASIFATEQLQRLSDQTKIQIDNQQRLNDLVYAGTLITGGTGIGMEAINLSVPLAAKMVQPKSEIPNINYGNLKENISNLINGITPLMDVVFSKLQLSPEELKKIDNTYKDFEDNVVERINTLSAKMVNISENKIGFQAAKNFTASFVDVLSSGKEIPEEISKLLGNLGENVKNTPEFDKSISTVAKQMGIIIDSENKKTVTNFIMEWKRGINEIATTRMNVGHAIGASLGQAYGGILQARGGLRQYTQNIGDMFKQFMGGGVTSMNEVFNDQKSIYELRKTNNREILRTSNEILKAEKLVQDAQDTGNLSLETRKKAEIEILRLYLKDVNALQDTLDKIQQIAAQVDLIKAKTVLANAEIEYQKEKSRNLNKEYERRFEYLNLLIDSEYRFGKAIGNNINSATKLGNAFKVIQDKIIFKESNDSILSIVDNLSLMENYEMKVLQAKARVQEIEKRIEGYTIGTSDATKEQMRTDLADQTIAKEDLQNKEADLKFQTGITGINELQNRILDERIKLYQEINKQNKEMYEIGKNIAERQEKLSDPIMSKELMDAYELNKTTQDLIDLKIKAYEESVKNLDKEYIARGLSVEQYQLMLLQKDNIEKLKKNKSDNLAISENELKIARENLSIAIQQQKYSLYGQFGGNAMGDITSARSGYVTQIRNLNRDIGALFGKETSLTVSESADLKTMIRLRDIYKDLAYGGYLDRINTGFIIMAKNVTDNIIAQGKLENVIKDIAGAINSYISSMQNIITEDIVNAFFPDVAEAEKRAEDLKKINDDYAKKIADIWKDYYDKLRDEELEHFKAIRDINNRFDDMRREKENEIYDERVNRLMSLAQLEEQLRYKGLTDEQQRADLMAEIDRGLSDSYIGTIEERQIKLGQLEEQIKSLNELENNLGMARDQIENSSIARLQSLQIATSDFYSAKRTDALNTIEAERAAEINAENQRHAEAVAKLQEERDRALQQAAFDKAQAIKELQEQQKIDNRAKDAQREFMMAIVGSIVRGITAKIVEYAVAALAPLGPFALLGVGAAVAGGLALAASQTAKLNAGGELKRATGGIIQGGHGGIDDIHTALPEHSFVINRQSTIRHKNELNRISRYATGGNVDNQLPVALTAGEYAILPPASIKYHNRLQQINNDRFGASERHYSGGEIGLASGGPVNGGSNVNVYVSTTFSGVNMVSGESESQVSEFYTDFIKDRIQKDISNKSINLR